MPRNFAPAAGESTSLVMTSGMAFPALNSGIDPSRIEAAMLLQGDDGYPLVPASTPEGALELTTVLQPGPACAWVWLRPRILQMQASGVTHYLEEIGADTATWAAWEAQPEPKLWRESYRKLARSYLLGRGDGDTAVKGAQSTEDCWNTASESRFDILPTADPSNLQAGSSLQVQVLFDGQPLAGQSVGLMAEGGTPLTMQRSDGMGIVNIEFKNAGQHLFYATNLRPQNGDDFNWESDFVTLSVNVSPPTSTNASSVGAGDSR
jgi:hypothetical protein